MKASGSLKYIIVACIGLSCYPGDPLCNAGFYTPQCIDDGSDREICWNSVYDGCTSGYESCVRSADEALRACVASYVEIDPGNPGLPCYEAYDDMVLGECNEGYFACVAAGLGACG